MFTIVVEDYQCLCYTSVCTLRL